MHVPDGFLSPQTAATMYAASIPFWVKATREAKSRLTQTFVPRIALLSAFCFVIMMFNIPLPGGTTGHAVGATVAAIILGPWVSILSVSMALIIQALFFGDGGILSLGANIFNMAIVMPITGYGVYRILTWNRKFISSKWRMIIAGIAGYIAINMAALCTGVELGIQPFLFHDITGHALYFPYGLRVSLSAMMIGHITVAGFAEAIVTSLTLGWFLRTNPSLIQKHHGKKARGAEIAKTTWILLGVLVCMVPLGLLAPGTAWGEWGREELVSLGLGYIPKGFDTWSSLWSSPFSEYNIPFLHNPTVAYILSGVIGVGLILILLFIPLFVISRIHMKKSSD
jgi:cobalt/nickel transport system permease protein